MNQYEWNLDEEYLAHHGILGQKWGVRRFQNEDGSLTPEGRKRIYGSGADGGYETHANRMKRSMEASKYQRDIDKTTKKLEKAEKKGDVEKQAEYNEIIKKLTKNKDIYMKDLSDEEIALGKNYVDNINRIGIGTLLMGPIGGTAIGMISAATNGTFEYEKMVKDQDKERYSKYKNQSQEEADFNARKAAQSAGLDQGDNWKMYRDAQAGDKRAQEVVKQWESEKNSSSTEKKGMSSKTINDRVSYAMKTGKFDMEFLEQNGDLDQRSGELLQGKQLEDAYKKWLKEQG